MLSQARQDAGLTVLLRESNLDRCRENGSD
jgi:hypothetical protein